MSASHPFHIYWHNQLHSTNNTLKDLANDNIIDEYAVVCAHNQISGKGQTGNFWESEPYKNLTFSLLLKPIYIEILNQFAISKAVALGILKLFENYSSNFSIKWPNDIYYMNQKIGGILIENSICNNVISKSIIGIGLNINQTIFLSDAPNPISLKLITGLEYDLNSILQKTLFSIHHYMNQIKSNPNNNIDLLYLNKLYRNKGEHLFKDSKGYFYASIHGITEYGHLELITQEGQLKTYAFKEVEFIIHDQDSDN